MNFTDMSKIRVTNATVEEIRSLIDVVEFGVIVNYLYNDPAIEMIIYLKDSLDIAEVAKRVQDDDTEWFQEMYDRNEIIISKGNLQLLLPNHPVECIRMEPIYLIKPA